MSKILTDSFAPLEYFGQRRSHRRRTRLVLEVRVDPRDEFGQRVGEWPSCRERRGSVRGDGRRDRDLGRFEEELTRVEGVVGGVDTNAVADRIPRLIELPRERPRPVD